jgi:hypothetical protein
MARCRLLRRWRAGNDAKITLLAVAHLPHVELPEVIDP